MKRETHLPLAVGFGLSKPAQLGPLRGIADGAIVGSAIVRHLEALTQPGVSVAEVLRKTGDYAGQMVLAAHFDAQTT
jgi:tryptophan synthase alpha chain